VINKWARVKLCESRGESSVTITEEMETPDTFLMVLILAGFMVRFDNAIEIPCHFGAHSLQLNRKLITSGWSSKITNRYN